MPCCFRKKKQVLRDMHPPLWVGVSSLVPAREDVLQPLTEAVLLNGSCAARLCVTPSHGPRPNSVEFTDILNTGVNMSRYIEGQDRQQVTLLPECLDDFIAEDNTVRIVDVFINELDLVGLGFDGAKPAATGRPEKTRKAATSARVARIPCELSHGLAATRSFKQMAPALPRV